jgi:hypothetical protein
MTHPKPARITAKPTSHCHTGTEKVPTAQFHQNGQNFPSTTEKITGTLEVVAQRHIPFR